MTSNLGSQVLARLPEGEPSESARDEVMEVVQQTYPPEFLNRIDDISLFNRLSRENMDQIVDIRVLEVQGLLKDRRIKLELTPEARTWLADVSYSPSYGARPLKRVIQNSLLNPLSTLILKGEVKDDDSVVATYEPGRDELRFSVRR